MMALFNHAAHVVIGGLVSYGLARGGFRHHAWFGGLLFAVYQIVERWAIRDRGYPELREFGIGFAALILGRWLMGHRDFRRWRRRWGDISPTRGGSAGAD